MQNIQKILFILKYSKIGQINHLRLGEARIQATTPAINSLQVWSANSVIFLDHIYSKIAHFNGFPANRKENFCLARVLEDITFYQVYSNMMEQYLGVCIWHLGVHTKIQMLSWFCHNFLMYRRHSMPRVRNWETQFAHKSSVPVMLPVGEKLMSREFMFYKKMAPGGLGLTRLPWPHLKMIGQLPSRRFCRCGSHIPPGQRARRAKSTGFLPDMKIVNGFRPSAGI